MESHLLCTKFPRFFIDGQVTHLDIRPRGIPPVRNQGRTKSCFGQVAIDLVHYAMCKEGIYRLELGSVQELINFTHLKHQSFEQIHSGPGQVIPSPTGFGNYIQNALRYIQSCGVCLDRDYPFVDHCQPFLKLSDLPSGPSITKIYLETFTKVTMAEIPRVLTRTPVGVTVLAYPSFVEWNQEGVYPGPSAEEIAGPEPTPHALLLVGMGETSTGDTYYTAKNSWGDGWCYQGYCKIFPSFIMGDLQAWYAEKISVK